MYNFGMNHGLHHLSARKRVYKNLETYPHPEKAKRWFDEFMYGLAIAGPFVILPQVIGIWFYKNVQGVSIVTWGLLAIIALFWLIYGLIHKEKPILVANFLLLIFNSLIIIGVLVNR